MLFINYNILLYRNNGFLNKIVPSSLKIVQDLSENNNIQENKDENFIKKFKDVIEKSHFNIFVK